MLQINDADYIYYNPGTAYYYMNDLDKGVVFKHDFPNAWIHLEKTQIRTTKNLLIGGVLKGGPLEPEDLKKYNIELISWEPSEPIVNEFK